jgi:hypothetical protein
MLMTLIILMILGMVAGLASRYRHAAIYSALQDQAIQASQVTFALLRKELLTAYEMVTPTPAILGPTPTLEFLRIDPNAPRLPADPNIGPDSWDPLAPDWTARVKYFASGQRLIREVTTAGVTTTLPVAEGVSSFSVLYLSNTNLEVEMSVKSTTRQTKLRTQIFRGRRDVP